MLTHLAIRDLVIVRDLSLDFGSGMTTLTGETGAGKSILIDALGLTLGDKADSSMIRQGQMRAEVVSEFDLSDCPLAEHWLREHDLDDDGQCLLRRVLVREGRSRAYINGTPAPQSALRELGSLLLDIHGQHAHQSLLKPTAQRQLLDAYAGLQTLAGQVAAAYQDLQDTRQQLNALQQATRDRDNRADYLRFQLDELKPTAEAATHIEEIESEHRRLANTDRLLQESGEIYSQLIEGEHDLSGQVARLAHRVEGLAQLDPTLQETADILDSAAIQLDEAGQGLRTYRDHLETDPYRFGQLDAQLGQLHDLARKHRTEISKLPLLLEQFQEELEALSEAEQNLETLQGHLETREKQYRKLAKKLSKSRHQAAVTLSATISDHLQELGMTGARFQVGCTTDPGQAGRHGIDQIAFLVAANPGQEPAPISDVASGGELSRISLAIQVATADCGEIPTLIFDEVDVGIGGAVAEIVGRQLRRLGENRQVLCITHLPQVAAQASHHFQVYKQTEGNITETSILPLDKEQRIAEIARMLGGVKITPQTLAHAKEILS